VYLFRRFLNRSKPNKTGIIIPEFVQKKLLFATAGLMINTLDQLYAGKSVQGGIECVMSPITIF
jgi:hypothetical protein